MDFAGYSALSGRKNWAQVRQDRLLESQFMRQMQSDLQARIEKEAQARAGVTEYMNQLNQASVLEQDLERVKGVEEEQRKAIVEGLKKAGNDYNKFLMGNGASLLNSYREGVMKSQEMQDAINNKLVFAQSSLDNYLGRKARPVPVTLPDGTTKEVSMDEQWKMFDNGEITKVNYAGSVVPTDMVKIQQMIQQTFSEDPYKRKQATKEDIYEYALKFGAEDWEAKQISEQYEGGLKQGTETPFYFNYKERPVIQGGVSDKMWDRLSGLMQGNNNMFSDYMNGFLFQDMLKGSPENVKWDGTDVELLNHKMVGEVYDKVMNTTELRYDTNDKVYYYMGKAIEPKSGKEIDMTEIDIDPQNILGYTLGVDKEGNKQGFVRVKVDLSQGEAKDKDLISFGGGIDGNNLERTTTFDVKGNFLKGGFLGKNRIVGEVLVPTTYNGFVDAQERYTGTKEDRYGENNLGEAVETQEVLNTIGGGN